MIADLSMLEIKSVIVHEVPQRERDAKVSHSEVESALTPDIKSMLRNRIIQGISSEIKGFDIEWDPESTSKVPPHIIALTDTQAENDFVARSQKIAECLFEVQRTISPGGILIFILGTVQKLQYLCIMKIEKQEGARLIRTREGKRTYDIQYLKDLILTPRTRLFKLAIFVRNIDDFEARASDNQRSYTSHKQLADYYLNDFLGCRMVQNPSQSTKIFFDATSEFLQSHFRSKPEEFASLYMALHSQLTSQKNTLSAKKFADEFLPADYKHSYLEFVKSKGLNPGSFDREPGLVASQLKKTSFDFASGTALIVPSEEVAQRVHLKEQKNGDVRVEFVDRLTKVRGK